MTVTVATEPAAEGDQQPAGPSTGAPSSVALIGLIGSLAVPVAVAVMWALAVRDMNLRRMTDLGLISVLPPLAWLALVSLGVNVIVLAQRRAGRGWLLGCNVVLFILLIHGTPAVLYGSLRYSYAWKHVGIVDYILRHGSVNRSAPPLSAYHNWPGFFAFVAVVLRGAGLQSALGIASWSPPIFNLLCLGPLLMIFRSRTSDRRLVWLAVWIFYLANWIGQDYFSPQAFVYVLYLTVLAIVLTWFGGGAARRPGSDLWRRLLPTKGRAVGDRHVGPAAEATTNQRVGLAGLLVVLMAVIASSHQLTPFMLIAQLVGLTVIGTCRPRGLAALMVAMAAWWVLVVARPFLEANLYWMIESIGHPGGNAGSNLVSLAKASSGQVLIATVDRVLSAAVLGLGVIGYLRRRRHGCRDGSMAVLAVSPIPLLVGNSYGGEMLFRVYLFSLPFTAFFVASLFFPLPSLGRRAITAVAAALTATLLLAGFLFSYYGKERMNFFTKQEVAVSRFVFDHAPAGSLVIAGTSNYPWGWQGYERFDYVFIGENEPRRYRDEVLGTPVETMTRLMTDPRRPGAYLVITRSQKVQTEMTGLMPAGSLDRLEQILLASGRFEIAYGNDDGHVIVPVAAPPAQHGVGDAEVHELAGETEQRQVPDAQAPVAQPG